jgi:hypothetical protein
MFSFTVIINNSTEVEIDSDQEYLVDCFQDGEEYEYDEEADCYCWFDAEYDAWYWLNEETGEWLLVEDDEADWGDDEEEYDDEEEEEAEAA